MNIKLLFHILLFIFYLKLMGDLPLIPGYSFNDCAIRENKIKHNLNYAKGCRTVCDIGIGTGKRPVDSSSSAYAQQIPEEVIYDPTLTYGRAKSYPYRQVIPHYVLYAQKCLKFNAFFRENVYNSPSEYHRVRHVNIIYFLEDDTICVVEPPVENAGLLQGTLVSRAKIPKNKNGQFYHWKDLNVGIDLAIYGIVYHTVNCDAFTNEFLQSQGIDVGDKEVPPEDSYILDRSSKLKANQAALAILKQSRSRTQDSRRRFLQYTGVVLTFEAIWNDDFYQIMYFLMDNTILIKEIPRTNNGKDPHRILLKRMKVPKNWTNMSNTFPSIYLECDDNSVEYYTPIDLKVGETICIFCRSFFLYDCDSSTRQYYSKMFNIEQPQKMLPPNLEPLSQYKVCRQTRSATLLEKNGRENKKDVIRKIFNHPKKLRYMASMVAVHPEDEGREFILEYNLSDGKIKINEIGKRNSGHRAGCFLAFMNVPKPQKRTNDVHDDEMETNDNVVYYTPEDFFIGAQINVFNHRFIIKGADLFVFRYVQANPEKFPADLIENMTAYFSDKQTNTEIINDQSDKKEKIIKEPILPVRKCESPVIQQNKIPNLSDLEICTTDEKVENELKNQMEIVPAPRQIKWADEVEVPCKM